VKNAGKFGWEQCQKEIVKTKIISFLTWIAKGEMIIPHRWWFDEKRNSID